MPTLSDVYREISEADALIHPALHEAFVQICLEASALGVPVICLKWGGPGTIVNDQTGYPVAVGTRAETVNRLADAITDLWTDKQRGVNKGEFAARQAAHDFSWSALATHISEKYKEVVRADYIINA